jgi:hypothetical protein
MSRGLPLEWCLLLDRITLRRFTQPLLTMSNGFFYEVSNNDMPTLAFLFLFFLLFIIVVYAFLQLERDQGGKIRHGLLIIFFFAGVMRLIILPGEMIHENDIYRYLWDGKTWINNINPFRYAPADLSLHEKEIAGPRGYSQGEDPQLRALIRLRDENPVYHQRIGYPEVPTIYPPFAQFIFAGSTFLREDSITVMKAVFLGFDMGVILLIVALLSHFQKDPRLCLLYAWSPLVLKEYANSGHYDPVPIFFMLLGIYSVLKSRCGWGVGFLALSFLSKFFAAVLLPIFSRRLRIRDMFLFAGIVLAAYIPFVIKDQTGIRGVFQGLMTYNEEWAYNGSLFALMSAIVKTCVPGFQGGLFPVKVAAGLGYAGVLAWLSVRPCRNDTELVHRCLLAIVFLFLINPVGDPWYFCWAMPLVSLFPYRSLILLSGLLILSYLNFRSDIPLLQQKIFYISTLSWIIYLPFYILVLVEKGGTCQGLYRLKERSGP